MSSKVIIREARPEDYDDLMEMGDVFFGKDYLIDHYPTYFNDPVIYPLVAEVDGKAVGFYFNHIIDDGQTLIKRAARVHPSYRGRGIFHLLSEALDRHRAEFWPGVRREVFGTTARADRASKEFQDKGFVEVIRKRVMNMHVRLQELKGLEDSTETSRVFKLTIEDMKLIFANDDLVNRLIPKRILYNWHLGYRIHESNIKYLINDSEFVLASTSLEPSSKQISPTGSDIQNSENFSMETVNKIDILSCAHRHVGVLGLSQEIDFYTADGFEESMLKVHLIKHFQDFVQSTDKDGITMITFNNNVKEDILLSYLKELGVTDFIVEMETHKVFYERKILNG